jgi:hypothetical protein
MQIKCRDSRALGRACFHHRFRTSLHVALFAPGPIPLYLGLVAGIPGLNDCQRETPAVNADNLLHTGEFIIYASTSHGRDPDGADMSDKSSGARARRASGLFASTTNRDGAAERG